MNLKDTEILAKTLINESKINGWIDPEWSFDWTRSRKVFGLCEYTSHKIILSLFFVPYMDEKSVKETILHEIAHAMCDIGEGHGALWKKACRILGLTNTSISEECPKEAESDFYRYVIKRGNKPVKWYINRPSDKILARDYPETHAYKLVRL